MKIQCYREFHSLDNVTVLSLSHTELPASEVLEQRLTNIAYRPGLRSDDCLEEERNAILAPQRFRYRLGEPPCDEVVEAEGIVVGKSTASLLSFLERRYLPDEDSGRAVDSLVCQLHQGQISRGDWLRETEALFGPGKAGFSRRHMRTLGGEESGLRLLVLAESFDDYTKEGYDKLGPIVVRCMLHHSHVTIVSAYYVKVMDLSVPRWRFAVQGEDNDSVGGWDGHRYRIAPELGALPEALCRSLDRDGFSVTKSEGWFAPLPDLKAELLVRVPYPSEVSHLMDAGPAPTYKPFSRPALLLDSRRPVKLGRIQELEVLEDPEMAAAVITRRTRRGVYIPEMPPAPIGDIELSVEGEPASFLVGCWPR